MTQSIVEQTAAADQQRTARAFVGLFSTILGTDQNYPGEDTNPTNGANQYIIANPDGTYSTVGKAQSNIQGSGVQLSLSPMLIVAMAIGAYLLYSHKG